MERSFEPFQPAPNDFFETYPDGTRPPGFTARQSGNKRSAGFESAFGGRLDQSRLLTGVPTAAASLQAKKDSQESGEREAVATADLAGAIAPAAGQPAGALTGRIVFAGAGHGWTYLNANKTWTTQRGVNNEMMEDYGNLDQMTIFAFYCFNAGATVVPTRPIGHQTNEVVLDNDSAGVQFAGDWSDSNSTVFYGQAGDVPYRFAALDDVESATAIYTPDIPVAGFYPVYTWVRHGSDRTSQLYRINHTGGQSLVRVPHHLVGNGWVYLGTYFFNAGASAQDGSVIISNLQPTPPLGEVVIADAIRFGNGMGDVVPEPGATVSGYPREEEAARYWVQASLGLGQPTSIYETSGDDSSDNVGAPARMACEMNRETAGSFYQRIYVGFHSNAGGGRGAIGLYNDELLFPGTSTPHQFRLAQLIGAEVNNDLSSLTVPPLETAWHNRGANVTYARSDYAFGEIREDALGGEMDATIIEAAFHDSLEDARLLRDPKVRNAIGRASYQAVVRYMKEFDGGPLVFLPEPPGNVRAAAADQGIVITWSAPGAGGGGATGYVVYRSQDGYGFGNPVRVSSAATSVTVTDLPADADIYFRVAAVNAGGESLPSETVGCRRPSRSTGTRILFVNGFDRFDRTLSPRQTPRAGAYAPPGPSGTIDRVIPRKMNSFDYVVPHGQALSANGAAFDSCQNEAVINGQVKLADYAVVIWALGEESTTNKTFTSAEQSLLAAFMAGGGHLFVSGSEIAWDLDRSAGPSLADRAFLNNYLHAGLGGDANDDAATYSFTPAAGSIFAGDAGGAFDDGTGTSYNVDSPDVLMPLGAGALAALQYAGGRGGAAAIQYDGSSGGGRLVYLGFPFETITDPLVREAYLFDILRFFGALPQPYLASPQINMANQVITLTWGSIPGKRYLVQSKPSLNDAVWADLGPATVASRPTMSREDDLQGVRQRFYRVLLVDE